MSNLSGSGTIRGTIRQGGGGSSDVYWDDILDKPTFAEVATSGDYNDLSNKPTLAEVATSGDYDDLSNKPNIPVYTAGTGIDITNNVISATGGGSGVDITEIEFTQSGNIITLSESFRNYEFISIYARNDEYTINNTILTRCYENTRRISLSDDAAFQWWRIEDDTHFNLAQSGGSNYTIYAIYGLQRKTEVI